MVLESERNVYFAKYKFIYIAHCIYEFHLFKSEHVCYKENCVENWISHFYYIINGVFFVILYICMCNTINKALTLTDHKIVTKYLLLLILYRYFKQGPEFYIWNRLVFYHTNIFWSYLPLDFWQENFITLYNVYV